MVDVRTDTHEVAGHLILVNNCKRRKHVNITREFIRAWDGSLHPVSPSSSVEKPVPLSGMNTRRVNTLEKERNSHRLVDPDGVGLFIPAIRVLTRGVVRV